MATRPWILAIDFGTSYTVAAALVEGRSAEVVEIDGDRRVPSVVLAEGDSFVVGKLADELASAYPSRTLRAPKRRIGDTAPIVLDGRPHQIVDLVAALLGHVHGEAVRQFGGAPSEVRLTHPAVWVRPQLNRLLEAASLAGITNALLVPEPVAAALSYATEVGVAPGSHVAVYDLGGGTFDTAVVTPADRGFRIVGRPGGDPSIGGELFDDLLTAHVGSHLDPSTWTTIQTSDDPTWRRLDANMRHEIRRAKETLSGYPVAEILVPVPGELVHLRVTREEYEALIEDHVEATIDLLERCVHDAGSDPAALGAVYLVGGASRTPLVARRVEARFPGIPISRRGDPKTSTAVGAALAVRPGDAAPGARPGAAPVTPPPTPFAGEPISRPPSVPPPAPPPDRPSGPPPAAGPPPVSSPPVSSPPVSSPPVSSPPVSSPPVTSPAPAATAAAVASAPTRVQPATVVATAPPRRRRRGLWIGLTALVVAGGAAGAFALTRSGDDAAGDTPATTATAATVGSTRCVRQDIDFAAVRNGPSRNAGLLTRIPAGSCDVTITARDRNDGGTFWLGVSWQGTDGFSAESNFLAAGTDPATVTTAVTMPTTAAVGTTAAGTTAAGTTAASTETTVIDGLFTGVAVTEFEDFVLAYYALTNARDYPAAWAYLTPRHQDLFGSFAAFGKVFDRIDDIALVEFSGCTRADAPADCFFLTDVTNTKGGTSRNMLRFSIVHDGIGLRVDDSEVDFLECRVKNPGENGCSAG